MRATALALFLTSFGAAAQAQTEADAETAPAAVASRHAGDAYLERSFIAAIDDRCALFGGAERAALDAARYQARNALLRGGVAPATVNASRERATGAAADAACDDSEILGLADHVSAAFAAYSALRTMEFPGSEYDWFADRSPIAAGQGWAALQTARVDFGLAATPDGLRLAVAAPEGVDGLTSAIIHVRDPERESRPFDATLGGLLPSPPQAVWARYTPPDHASIRIWASERLTGARAEALSGPGFIFPEAAIEALEAADPRETARIDFQDATGVVRDRLYVEIGDFAAALGFLRATHPSRIAAAASATASYR